ncbi:MAG: 2Fe-2S iron-sulfur cluster-binding protein [Pseudomonadota bacterium]
MPKITFIAHDGFERNVDAGIGQSVMQAAVGNMVDGIVADCGGACCCATCHGYLDEAWVGRVPAAGDDESAMLECATHRAPNSRLTCQIKFTAELDGLIVRLPVSQY